MTQSSSGKEPPYKPPTLRAPELTLAEACAKVDAWGPEQQFGLHEIARVLRAAVALLPQSNLGDAKNPQAPTY